jgi:hypothetical protein
MACELVAQAGLAELADDLPHQVREGGLDAAPRGEQGDGVQRAIPESHRDPTGTDPVLGLSLLHVTRYSSTHGTWCCVCPR